MGKSKYICGYFSIGGRTNLHTYMGICQEEEGQILTPTWIFWLRRNFDTHDGVYKVEGANLDSYMSNCQEREEH